MSLALKHASQHVEILHPAEYARWDELVRRSAHGTIFHHSWWLEATGRDFEILVCRDRDGQIVAGIPLPRKTRAGITLFHSPMLTPYLGPIFDVSRAVSMNEKLSLVRQTGEALARAIKGYDSLIYLVGASAPDLQGFLWADFRATVVGYTFRFDGRTSIEQVMKEMTDHHKRNLAKAQRRQTLVQKMDANIDILLDLTKQTFARQGLPLPYPESLARRLWSAAQCRQQGDIYLACDAKCNPVAGLLTVHDTRCTYQIVSGMSPGAQNSGGCQLVIWRAIDDSLLAGRMYDFEGSSIRGVEHYYRQWGGVAKPVCRLERAGSLRGSIVQKLIRHRNRKLVEM